MIRRTLPELEISFPERWVVVDRMGGNNDEAAKILNVERLTERVDPNHRLIVFDVENTRDRFTPNMNLLIIRKQDGTTTEEVIQANVHDLSNLMKPGTSLEQEEVRVGGREATRFAYIMDVEKPNGEIEDLQFFTFIQFNGVREFAFSFSGWVDQKDELERQSARVMNSVKFNASNDTPHKP